MVPGEGCYQKVTTGNLIWGANLGSRGNGHKDHEKSKEHYFGGYGDFKVGKRQLFD